MDYPRLAAQLVRARRGARTQKALSKALGYKSNVLFAWEHQYDEPSARAFFALVKKTGRAFDLGAFTRNQPVDCGNKSGVAEFLRVLCGDRKVTELAGLIGRDRYAVGRWLRGQAEIPLPDFLHFIELTTLSVLDFLAVFVDPNDLDEAREPYRKLMAARAAARETPWAHAVVHLADLPSYTALPHHEPGWFASRLGVTISEEERCLEHLVLSGQLLLEAGRYRRAEAMTVDTRSDPEGTRRLAAFWLEEGARRVLAAESGRFAFNTFAVSRKDLDKIKALGSEYFHKLRTIVAQSQPTEAVAVATFQLLPLGVEGDEPSATPEPRAQRRGRS